MAAEYAELARLCRDPACKAQTFWFCPGCRKQEGGEGGAGHYCLAKGRNCFAKHHRKLRRTPADECEQCEE